MNAAAQAVHAITEAPLFEILLDAADMWHQPEVMADIVAKIRDLSVEGVPDSKIRRRIAREFGLDWTPSPDLLRDVRKMIWTGPATQETAPDARPDHVIDADEMVEAPSVPETEISPAPAAASPEEAADVQLCIGRYEYWGQHPSEMLETARELIAQGLSDSETLGRLSSAFPRQGQPSRTTVGKLRRRLPDIPPRPLGRRPGSRGSYWDRNPPITAVATQLLSAGWRYGQVLARLCRDFPEAHPPSMKMLMRLGQTVPRGQGLANGTQTIWDQRPDMRDLASALIPHLKRQPIIEIIQAQFGVLTTPAQVSYLKRGLIDGRWAASAAAQALAVELVQDRSARKAAAELIIDERACTPERWDAISRTGYNEEARCRMPGMKRLSKPGCYQYQLRRVMGTSSLYGPGPLAFGGDDGQGDCFPDCQKCRDHLTKSELERLREALDDGFRFPRSPK